MQTVSRMLCCHIDLVSSMRNHILEQILQWSVIRSAVLCQAWRCVAHAESIAQRKLSEQRAQEGMGDLGLDNNHKGDSPASFAFFTCACLQPA